MLALIAGAAAAAGAVYTGTRGVPVRSGRLGNPSTGPQWRVRWALWRWKAQVWTVRNGWMPVGEYKTEQTARGAALAKAMEHVSQPAIEGVMLTSAKSFGVQGAGDVTGDAPAQQTSFTKGDV